MSFPLGVSPSWRSRAILCLALVCVGCGGERPEAPQAHPQAPQAPPEAPSAEPEAEPLNETAASITVRTADGKTSAAMLGVGEWLYAGCRIRVPFFYDARRSLSFRRDRHNVFVRIDGGQEQLGAVILDGRFLPELGPEPAPEFYERERAVARELRAPLAAEGIPFTVWCRWDQLGLLPPHPWRRALAVAIAGKGARPSLLQRLSAVSALFATGIADRELRALGSSHQLQSLRVDSAQGISDLSPIAELKNLVALSLEPVPNITDLSPLSGLGNLRVLRCRFAHRLATLDSLGRLGRLRALDLTGCTALRDVAVLSGLGRLRRLSLAHCLGVSDLSPVGGLSQLRSLEIGGTATPDLRAVGALESLVELRAGRSRFVTSLAPLARLKNLRVLDLGECQGISDLSPLSELLDLARLDLFACGRVSDLRPLTHLAALRWVDLRACDGVHTLAPLAELVRKGATIEVDERLLGELKRLRR